jgi:hypothetical protein
VQPSLGEQVDAYEANLIRRREKQPLEPDPRRARAENSSSNAAQQNSQIKDSTPG